MTRPPDRARSRPFGLDVDLGGPVRNSLLRAVRPSLERIAGLADLQAVYDAIPPELDGVDFLREGLRILDVGVRISERDRARLATTGPAVFVANHPFGGLEGMVLAVALGEARDDVRLLANYLLARMPELRRLFLSVDPFGGRTAVRGNLAALRAAARWLHDGGALGVFPAGEVAHWDRARRRVVDPVWNPTAIRLARDARCPVVPVFFPGRNDWWFQSAGALHARLRTALLPRALLARRHSEIEVRVGTPVKPARLRSFSGAREATAYVRDRVEVLEQRAPALERAVQPRSTPSAAEAIVDPVPRDRLRAEIAALPVTSRLGESEGLEVRIADAAAIPGVLREIGRLREVTFREAGEGTGRAIDLDRFDDTYRHLFVWNAREGEIVGAYRIGATDRVGGKDGAGLYTSTLFRYRPELFEAMGPALELGRSFIRPEYQRSYAGLLLLWKGIGRTVAEDPSRPVLFGPVSISAEYRSVSQRWIVSFLERNRKAHEWSRYVRPRKPFKPGPRRGTLDPASLRDLDDVSAFIGDVEADGKGVPILLRQYLNLGGRLLGFNVDPEFANVLDVLLMVDLRRTSPRILARYLGRDGRDAFLAHHGISGSSRAG